MIREDFLSLLNIIDFNAVDLYKKELCNINKYAVAFDYMKGILSEFLVPILGNNKSFNIKYCGEFLVETKNNTMKINQLFKEESEYYPNY